MTDSDRGNLVRVLSDFASWLEPRPGLYCDMAYYKQLATHYLEIGGARDMVDVPTNAQAWCDLCGHSFWRPADHRPETITGRGFCWCPACASQQYYAMSTIGPEAYRKAWQEQESGA